MYRLIAVCLICILFLEPAALSAQTQSVSADELSQALRLASEKRNNDIKAVREFFSVDAAKKALNAGNLDIQKVERAVSVLDDNELSQLASRVQAVQKDMVAGALTTQQLTYIVIALAAAVL